MNDYTANQIVFLILVFIVLGILFVLNIIGKAYLYGKLGNLIKNNSGNFSATHILMLVAAISAIFFLSYWLFMRKSTVRVYADNTN